MTLSEKLLYLRAKNNWTQKQLAEKLEITPVTVSQLENSVREKTTTVLARKIDLLLEKGE
jgi:transcriptional regulator with XRE-family HTH domain